METEGVMKTGKKWVFSSKYTREAASKIAADTGMPMLPARILAARGVTDGESARSYLDKSPKNLHDPMLMPDMDKAVYIITNAIENGVKIAVYGDYDVDGVTSTCIMMKYLRSRGADCVYYIPDRLNEGYGLSSYAIGKLADEGAKLIITVDTGITAVDEVDYAHALGMKIVVTDHHECKLRLPDADAVVNPKRPDGEYPFKDLAGVGVAFKVVCALAGAENFDDILCEYSSLTALGTVADLMPLVDENRAIASFGMKMLEADLAPGYAALARHCELDANKRASAISISYVIAPRINAAGRFGCAEKSVELFLTDDPIRADVLAGELCAMNRQRQAMENDIRDEAMEKIKTECDLENDSAVVLWNQGWHHGIIGVVTSKLADQLGKPVILLCVEGDEARGSGRSVEGFNLFAALQANAGFIEKFGGHELASGLTVKTENLQKFRESFLAYAKAEIHPGECIPILNIDCEAEAGDFNLDSVTALSILEPFGMANPQPVFCLRGLRVVCVSSIGGDRHTRLILAAGPMRFDAVHFGAVAADAPYVKGSAVDVVFCADINMFRGRSVQFIVRDIRLTENVRKCNNRDIGIYTRFIAGENVSAREAYSIVPCRNDQVAVWRWLAANAKDNELSCPPEDAALRVKSEYGAALNPGTLLVCCAVFGELGLSAFEYDGVNLRVRIAENHAKRDMSDSEILTGLKRIAAVR
jgi:single-stranded-DNA-specific exonuclease